DWPASVLIVNTSRSTPSGAGGCEICNESRSDPGGAGVVTSPSAALVSPAGSVSSVTPGAGQGLSAVPPRGTPRNAARPTATKHSVMIISNLKRATALKAFSTALLLNIFPISFFLNAGCIPRKTFRVLLRAVISHDKKARQIDLPG